MQFTIKFPGILFLSVMVMLSTGCKPRKKQLPLQDNSRITLAFYNVENLYDISDDPRTNDQEYLPGSPKKWDQKKYLKKIEGLSRVLKELGDEELPEIIGLCEVENAIVVEDLGAHENLASGRYEVVHFNDRDSRGIDMALVYRPSEFQMESAKLLPVKTSQGNSRARGILSVTGKLANGEILHIFVNHWPSRDNDQEQKKEAGRNEMALSLRKITDSLRKRESDVHIVIMGDMNDEPDDESLLRILEAGAPGQETGSGLVNLMFPAFKKGEGTYKYKGNWQMLDHFVVSRSLMDTIGYRVENSKGKVFSKYWMEFQNNRGFVSPDRTYLGDDYTGGISDHFPVFCRLVR